MNSTFETTWETYVSSWKAKTEAEKHELYRKSLAKNCNYNDPISNIQGWDNLDQYMLEFHKQIPGGYFETTSFMSHSNKSIATWKMKNGDDVVVGDGISYGEYNDQGLLTVMTAFFETPA